MISQIEMTFGGSGSIRPNIRRQRRFRRAHWWFEQMRQVVDRAIARRSPIPPAPPEQTYLSLATRASCDPKAGFRL